MLLSFEEFVCSYAAYLNWYELKVTTDDSVAMHIASYVVIIYIAGRKALSHGLQLIFMFHFNSADSWLALHWLHE